MKYIFSILAFIFVCYSIYARPIKALKAFKDRGYAFPEKSHSRKEWTFRTKAVAFLFLGSPFIISIIICHIMNWQQYSDFWMCTFAVFMFECVICGIWGSIKEIIKFRKEHGLIETIIFTILAIIGLLVVLHYRYHDI